jgi:hypothetical protein
VDTRTLRNFLVLSCAIFGTVYILKNQIKKKTPVTTNQKEVQMKKINTPQKDEVIKFEEKKVSKTKIKKLKKVVPILEKILPGSKEHKKIVMDRVKGKEWYRDGQKYVAAYIYDYIPKNWAKKAAIVLRSMFDQEPYFSKNFKGPKFMNVSNRSESSGCKVTPYPRPFVIIGSYKNPGRFGSINMFAKVKCGGRIFTGLFNVKTSQLMQVFGEEHFEVKEI